MINVLLIGLGPHARRIQLPILLKDGVKYGTSVKVVIDITSQEQMIRTYLAEKQPEFAPELMFLEPDQMRLSDNEINIQLSNELDLLVEKYDISAVFICTEPAYHAPYAKWALRKALHVFMDKPISAPPDLATSSRAVGQITTDYMELAQLYKKQRLMHPELIFELMTQRRYHPAFHEIDRLIREVKERTSMPITSFQSTHSDGQWRMPDEIVDQDYHPYNQGYGKCLHSGYHAIDITNWLVRRSYGSEHTFKDIELFANFIYPNDFLAQLPPDRYGALFSGFEKHSKYTSEELSKKNLVFGEIDAQISTTYKDAQGRTLTTGQLSLIHNGFAQRNWPTAEGRDLYKGNGRVRHETHYLAQGPFQTIYFQSLQSEEILNEQVNHSDVGGEYHLDIHVFRNSKMFPEWKSYEKISLNDLSINILEGYSRGHQEDARRSAILTFLKSITQPDTIRYSDLLEQDFSVGMIGAAYRSALNRKRNLNPLVKVGDELALNAPGVELLHRIEETTNASA